MNAYVSIIGGNLILVLAMMLCLWAASLILKDASIADIFWGLGFVVVAWISFARGGGYLPRKILITILVTLWGLRLAYHIGRRNRGRGEDLRYRAWRAKYAQQFWWVSLFTVFGLQGVLLWLVSLALQAGQIPSLPAGPTWLDGLGLLVWIVGFVFEAVGDRQLARFKSDPENKGKVMNRGLWAYTRHPNYFGESLMWWGIFLITLSTGQWWTLISPLVITFLLLKVSGVTLLEKTIVDRRPKYRDYKERTSAFIPWFRKKSET
jgi:steroid 5-alpha reductase family enzyme